jgi:phosphatidylserine decarboxylase
MIRIHREGIRIVTFTILASLVVISLSALLLPGWSYFLTVPLSIGIVSLVLRFFRFPRREPHLDAKTVTAPADGRIVVIERVNEEEFIGGACQQVSIFMSIHDVHINYFPLDGMVTYQKYHPGKYLVARNPKSSQLNERYSIGIHSPHGPLLVRQIAGTVARRIRCYAVLNAPSRQGEELGFIKFGSRLDLFLPLDCELLVELRQQVTGSVTPIARYK